MIHVWGKNDERIDSLIIKKILIKNYKITRIKAMFFDKDTIIDP